MARFTLEWRQSEQGPDGAWFAHRMAYAYGAGPAKEMAETVGDRAWGREFRFSRHGMSVFTDLQRIREWDPAADLPDAAPRHVWRKDLGRSLVADRFLQSVRKAVDSAVAADVLLRADANALLRFALASLRRPSL